MKSAVAAVAGAVLTFGLSFAAVAETGATGKAPTAVSSPAATPAPEPVRVVSANPSAGPVNCQNVVWPNVPAECLKGKDGAAPAAKPVRVVGAQDDLRTNPAAASDAGKPAKKLRRLPAKQ